MTKNLTNQILIADDDINHRNFLKKLIKNSKIKEVSKTDDLIKKAKERNYDLIITDYDMQEDRSDTRVNHGSIIYPEQTGLYAIEKIREFDRETPIIMNSSGRDIAFIVEVLKKGANSFISKYASEDEFKENINKYLNASEEEKIKNYQDLKKFCDFK
jgi:two-component system chemotaxis response regulator CheY|tara:strand:- start:6002 stop:6475 length:474 start_codon:yes stop_codon:yes gene_type:complete